MSAMSVPFRRTWSPERRTADERKDTRQGRSTVQTPLLVHEEEIMSVPREGGCACGEVRYRLTSDPLFTHCCHCLNCQRQTGSAFVINLLIEADRVELLAGVPQPVDVPPTTAAISGSSDVRAARWRFSVSTDVPRCGSFAAA